MTVPAPSPRFVAYAGDGGAGPFPIPFRFLDAADVKAAVTDADGARTLLAGCLVEGAGDPDGGQLTPPQPVLSGQTLTLWTDTALVQPADYIAADAFPADTHEAALDRLTLIAQDARRDLDRGLRAPLGETLTDLPAAAARAGMVLTFDEAGQPDTSRTYEGLVGDVAAGLGGEAAAELIAEITTAGAEANALILTAESDAIADINAASADRMAELGLAGAIFDVVPASQGYDGGLAITDPNGWTTPDFHFSPLGTAGPVIRAKIIGQNFSALSGAYRVYVPPPVLPFQINLLLISGPSNSEDADAVPIIDRTPQAGIQMLGAGRPRHYAGSFTGLGFTDLLGAEHIDGSYGRWGGDSALAAGKTWMDLITAENGQAFGSHGRVIVPVHIGRSGTWITDYDHGSAHFATIIDWCQAAKAAADAAGKTIGIVAGVECSGAQAYDLGLGLTTSKTDIHNFWKLGGDVDLYLSAVFGQTGTEFPVGFIQSSAHGARGVYIDPYVAQAEIELVETYARYSIINPDGSNFYNGAGGGFAASGVHKHSSEAQRQGCLIGWWAKRVVTDAAVWPSLIPSIFRTTSSKITASFPDIPAGATLRPYANGLTPRTMQPNYNWFFCDPATPTAELTLSRPPYADGQTLVFEFAAALPTNVELRHGARSSGNIHAGNFGLAPTGPTRTIAGASEQLRRMIPVLKRSVA